MSRRRRRPGAQADAGRLANLAGLLVVVLFALALSAPASAGTIAVTTTVDQRRRLGALLAARGGRHRQRGRRLSGGCTDANPAAADTIKLAGGDYNLQRAGVEDANASGDLDVTESLTIAGAGAELTGIDGNGAITGDRVLQFSSGILTISGLTIHDGRSTSWGGGIVGLHGHGPETQDHSVVSGNTRGGLWRCDRGTRPHHACRQHGEQ